MHSQLPSPPEIARQLHGEVRGGRVYFSGPGHKPADRSAWLQLDPFAPDGFIVGTFSTRDDWQAIKDCVRERLELPDWRSDAPRRQPVIRTIEPDAGQRERTDSALCIWRGAVALPGTLGEAYLSRIRQLKLGGEDLSHVLRFHGGLRFEGHRVGGIVALLREAITNEPCGIHRTFLDSDGHKLGRKMLGQAKGAAVKLDAHEDVTLGLHIGEGIETCLAARQLGYRPTWALGSAGVIKALPVLAEVEAITVFAENDDASTRAAEACAERHEAAGCEAWICEPPQGDLNDAIRRAA